MGGWDSAGREGIGMDLDDAGTLIALLHARNGKPIGDLIGGWDPVRATARKSAGGRRLET